MEHPASVRKVRLRFAPLLLCYFVTLLLCCSLVVAGGGKDKDKARQDEKTFSRSNSLLFLPVVSSFFFLFLLRFSFFFPVKRTGTEKLALALPSNEVLEILDLTSNAIGDRGATSLALAFVNKEGATTDAAAAKEEDEEEAIPVEGDQLTFDSIDPDLWRPNASLRSLLLSGNSIGPDGAQSLSTIVSVFFVLSSVVIVCWCMMLFGCMSSFLLYSWVVNGMLL